MLKATYYICLAMKRKIRFITILGMAIIFAVIVICILFYIWIPRSTNADNLSDCQNDLLYKKQFSVDYSTIFSGNNEVSQVATKYSVLYKKNTNRIMYVASMPLRNLSETRYSPLNTNIKMVSDKSYVTTNQSYDINYEQTYVRIGDMNDWLKIKFDYVQSVSYSDSINILNEFREGIHYKLANGNTVSVSPVYNGILVNCRIKSMDSLKILTEFKKYRINNDDAGYVVLSEYGSDPEDVMANNYFVISSPIINSERSLGKMFIKRQAEGYALKFALPEDVEYPVELTFTISLYCDNMFFDCAAYEDAPKENHIFDSYVVFDNLYNKKQTHNFLKVNIRSFTPKESELLDRVLLNINVLSSVGETTIEVYSVRFDWCSWLLTWNNQPIHDEKIGEFIVNDVGWYSIDLTEYVKKLIDENYYNLINNSIMFKVQSGSEGYVILASGDNSVFPPFFEVYYRIN